MLKDKIKNTILENKMICEKQHVVLGLSGGPDSMCLFDVLFRLKKEMNFTLHAVHINHKMRPIDAEEDMEYVKNICSEREVKFYGYVYDVISMAKAKSLSSEEAGREARYEAFYSTATSIAREMDVPEENIKIAVAQNMDDQSETILMRIIRGTGTDGLAGMEYVRAGEGLFEIIRPLLDVSRKEIEEYCVEYKLNPRIDKTNSEALYTRNKIRLNLLPILQQEFNGNIKESLVRLGRIATEDKDFMESCVDKAIESMLCCGAIKMVDYDAIKDGCTIISIEKIKELHSSVRKRIIKRQLENMGLTQGVSAVHMEAVEDFLKNGKAVGTIVLPHGYEVHISYGEMRIIKCNIKYAEKADLSEVATKKYNINLKIAQRTDKEFMKDNVAFDLEKLLSKIEKTTGCEKERILEDAFSGAELELDKKLGGKMGRLLKRLDIRTRRTGDYIVPLGMTGRKKIQNLFVDAKVYKEKRDLVPLVAIDDEVIWVIGDDVSNLATGMKKSRVNDNYKVSAETKYTVSIEFVMQVW